MITSPVISLPRRLARPAGRVRTVIITFLNLCCSRAETAVLYTKPYVVMSNAIVVSILFAFAIIVSSCEKESALWAESVPAVAGNCGELDPGCGK